MGPPRTYQPRAAARRTRAATAAASGPEPQWPLGRQRLCLIGRHSRRQGFRLRRLADFKRLDVYRLSDVLQLHSAEIAHFEIEPLLDLPVGLL
jgi:hypothetical protein